MIDISKMTKPAVVGGLVAGILTGIPYVGMLCCLWFIAGGAIAAWMLIGQVGRIEITDGAIVGALSGAIAGLVAGVIGVIFMALGFGAMSEIPGMGDVVGLGVMGLMIVGIIVNIILGAIFGAIGGVIVAKVKE